MPPMNTMALESGVCHLCLIGDSKTGKSTYIAQAIKDGFSVLYLDSDNGRAALERSFNGNDEYMSRVDLIQTTKPSSWLHSFVTESRFRWNVTKDIEYKEIESSDDDLIQIIWPAKIPSDMILVVDAWKTVAIDCLRHAAGGKKVTIDDMGGQSQQVYGDANRRATLILAVLQQCKFNVIVIGHKTFYERFMRPEGNLVADIKQKDMILMETLEVPISTSRPHGNEMGSYFTDVGWLEINRIGERIIDFKPKYGRVSGGAMNKSGGVMEMSWAKTFGANQKKNVPFDESWIQYRTVAELKASRLKQNPDSAKVASESGVLTKTATNPMMALKKS